ncbi:dipeptidyl-peptidase-like protein V precursor [Patellaria atrata CBS 101060]|uniref:Dipeptidyl-peptidase V n=1 Tax=Patellaria atrata CBS 101060 TaxID=1346257 RepID=A0A9P4VP52_9PEZI|nr:dipeptidyl-peptidase-like protein V precursor [Patellaria atrata CBS 101060]
MTVRATKFTPEVLLSAPRRSAGVPNWNGSFVLYSVSTYSFAEQERKSEIRVLNVLTGESTLLTNQSGAREPNWLDDGSVLLLTSGDEGATNIVIGSVDGFQENNYTAGTVNASISNIKLKTLESGAIAIAFSALAKPDGSLYNEEIAPKYRSTGKLYKEIFVRHWDTWITPNRNSIFYGTLSKGSDISSQYELSSVTNALKGTNFESPIPPFGGTDNFDLSTNGIVFVAKDPKLLPATHTKVDVYYIPISDFTVASSRGLQEIARPGFKGASSSPVFSPDGKQIAFLSMKQDGYESDKNQLFVVPDVNRPGWVMHYFAGEDDKGAWKLSPDSITWRSDGKVLYFLVSDYGRVALYYTPTAFNQTRSLPKLFFRHNTISDIRPLENGRAFLSGTSMIDNSFYATIESDPSKPPRLVSSASRNGTVFGLSPSQISEVEWDGAANGTKIHAWVIKPSNFSDTETYPLAYYIHGGPQGAWGDSWSTRWNYAVLAEQGYVVVAPNPTGSTGYGQEFTDAIQNQWGGLPYQDLVKGFAWIEQNLDFVDTDRAVALGASYGGYMMNWIQGHPLGRKFKALMTHDGVFSMTAQVSSEELWFPEHDLGGKFWNHQADWARWDPSRFAQNWATPHLIIHSELDYRLTIAEGLAAFNVLQDKGIESQFLTFPDENHWVLNPENSLLWHTVVFDWLNSHVGLPKYSETDPAAKAALEGAMVVGRTGLKP